MSENDVKQRSALSNILLTAILLLPLAGLCYSWATTHAAAQRGTDWDIPVRGYDPRDLLRGHYIQFEYDWPNLAEGNIGNFDMLCIKGNAPNITSVSRRRETTANKAGCDGILRADLWSEEYDRSMTNDRLFIPQTKGVQLEAKLRDPKLQGVVRARIREDGKITPQSISFRANPNPEGVQRDRQTEIIDAVGADELPATALPPPENPSTSQ